jgi:hypothetical protein
MVDGTESTERKESTDEKRVCEEEALDSECSESVEPGVGGEN